MVGNISFSIMMHIYLRLPGIPAELISCFLFLITSRADHIFALMFFLLPYLQSMVASRVLMSLMLDNVFLFSFCVFVHEVRGLHLYTVCLLRSLTK